MALLAYLVKTIGLNHTLDALEIRSGAIQCARLIIHEQERAHITTIFSEMGLPMHMSIYRSSDERGVMLDPEGQYHVLYVGHGDLTMLDSITHDADMLAMHLGHPSCCAKTPGRFKTHAAIRTLPYFYRNEPYRLLSHVPCSAQCEHTLAIARRREELLESIDPFLYDEIKHAMRGSQMIDGKRYHFI